MTIELRRPCSLQDSGVFKASSHHRVAAIVLQNVSDHVCLKRRTLGVYTARRGGLHLRQITC